MNDRVREERMKGERAEEKMAMCERRRGKDKDKEREKKISIY